MSKMEMLYSSPPTEGRRSWALERQSQPIPNAWPKDWSLLLVICAVHKVPSVSLRVVVHCSSININTHVMELSVYSPAITHTIDFSPVCVDEMLVRWLSYRQKISHCCQRSQMASPIRSEHGWRQHLREAKAVISSPWSAWNDHNYSLY